MRIHVLTSGGDAPGMNAAIRTVAIAGMAAGHEVFGIRRGYEGLLAGDTVELNAKLVDGISRYGGTMLGSARSKVFPTEAGQAAARQQIAKLGIDALVVIGGNGSLTGAHALASDKPCTIVGLPASIDNDLGHCGMAIGVDTAVNTIVEACDRISDTARAHRRAFLVEVMGRHCGFLAMRAGIACEADAIFYAEDGDIEEDQLVERMMQVIKRGFIEQDDKNRVLIIKAEGVGVPSAQLVQAIQRRMNDEVPGVDIRETVLGHVVRGGNPSALDRVIAQRLAFGAVQACEKGLHDVMLSWDVPGGFGTATGDTHVRIVALADMISETVRLLDGSSPVTQGRIKLLKQVELLLSR